MVEEHFLHQRFVILVAPICLPKPYMNFAGKTAVAAGWGMTAAKSVRRGQSDTLQYVELQVSESEYKQMKLFGTRVRKENGDITDACSGDSGNRLLH